MNKHVKNFFQRGLLFAGFGPVIAGIIYAILDHTVPAFSLSGTEVLIAIISTYLLAFIQAGASVFNQIDHWSPAKSALCHFSMLYAAYVLCYLVNRWIPFEPAVLLVFTAIFLGGYLVIWLVVYFSVKAASKRLNAKIR